MAVKTIGTGGDRSTVATWEAGIGIGDDEAGPWVGQCLAQTHDTGIFTIAVTPPTSPTDYIRLTCAPNAYHKGVAADTGLNPSAHAVVRKASGIASLPVISVQEDYVEIDHLEIISNVTLTTGDFIGVANGNIAAANHLKFHHLLIHHNGVSTNSGNDGIVVLDADAIVSIYRNIIYGLGGRAFNLSAITAAGSVIHNNTVYANNRAAASGIVQYTLPAGDYAAFNNLGFEPNKTDAEIFDNPPSLPGGASKGSNASDYQPEPFEETFESITDLVATDVLRNATTTWTNTDCRLKDTASVIGLGTRLSPSFAESVRGLYVESAWDIGADDVPFQLNGRRWATGRPWASRPGWNRVRRVGALGAVLGLLLAMLVGCGSPVTVPVRSQVDAQVEARVEAKVEAVLASFEKRVNQRAGRDVNVNDEWTSRLAVASLAIVAAAYPIGKLLWLALSPAGRAIRRIGLSRAGASQQGASPYTRRNEPFQREDH